MMEIKKKDPMKGAVERILNIRPSKNDPNGSYTGKPLDRHEKPIQDADDL